MFFNTSVNIDGILTTINRINMNGGGTDTLNNNIATKEVRLKDILTGSDNSSQISTSANVLTVDSVGQLLNYESVD